MNALHTSLDRRLGAVGFGATGSSRWRHDGVTAQFEGGWLAMTVLASSGDGAGPLTSELGWPGLWKCVSGERGQRMRFDIPPAVLAAAEQDEGDQPLLELAVGWAQATAGGQLPAGWAAPPGLVAEDLVVQHGRFLRHGRLINDGRSLAVRVPLVPRLDGGLPEGRRHWLAAMLADAQDRWPMVRFGADGLAVAAEIDLSGAPAPLVELLLPISRDALRGAIAWLVESADFLADGRVACQALEVCRPRG